jgi:DNA/RNA-binding domain of Phe-tRNA-synthetase-like protein
MQPFEFHIDNSVKSLGIPVITALLEGVNNKQRRTEFEAYKSKTLQGLPKIQPSETYKDDLTLQGFRELHSKVGRSNRDYVASPEKLSWLWYERQRFPDINTVVNIYNLMSLKSKLALGAHDLNHINGNVNLRLTKGNETFIPLRSKEEEKIFPGEYGYVDDSNTLICRMEVLQIEQTKVTEHTQNIFLIAQGNASTTLDYVKQTAKETCELIVKFCGGNFKLLN